MLHIICGAPCSGKSTYVREHAKPGELIVDHDAIAVTLGSAEPHAAEGLVREASFRARAAAIDTALEMPDSEAWIIDTEPNPGRVPMYEDAGAEFIVLDPGIGVCLQRAEQDGRPEGTAERIRKWYSCEKGAAGMAHRTKSFEVKAENGSVSGYFSTWTREPDFYGDVVAKGAFADTISEINANGGTVPLLWNHDANRLESFIGTAGDLREDEHGAYFKATFDDTELAQRARELTLDGRLSKFSFSYDVLDEATVTLEDGRKANELRKLKLNEISLVMYPANPDTGVVDVKGSKEGRRNSGKDEEKLRDAVARLEETISTIKTLLGEPLDEAEPEEPAKVNGDGKSCELLERIAKAINEER